MSDMQHIEWLYGPVKPVDPFCIERALSRQGCLTKPPGSLGRLEEIAVRMCGLLGDQPDLAGVSIVVFAGDHGVAQEGVSAFPQVVTGEMVKNFARGGAAICVLANALGANLEVVNLGTVNHPGELPGVIDVAIAPSTANLCETAAMSETQLMRSLHAGYEAAKRAVDSGSTLFVGGDMGIANTTSATALGCAYLGLSGKELVGPGTGLDSAGVAHKAEIIDRALMCHHSVLSDPKETLRCLGGFEIAALSGAYIACAQMGLPVLVDGFIAGAAALAALRINPAVSDWLFLSHASAEPGHKQLTKAMGMAPLIDLGMRLGEGSGAAVSVPLLRMACELHNGMATFEEAGVSEG